MFGRAAVAPPALVTERTMTRRNTKDDPLVRVFLDTYKINLLSVPREKADVGDAYVANAKGVSAPGQLRHLLTPELVMPKVNRDEKLTNLAGKATRAIELKAGIKLLEDFFSAIGADMVIGKIRAEYEHKRAGLLRFKLRNATRDSVDAFEFGKALIPCQLNAKQPFVAEGNRYYVTVGVVRSTSITVGAESESDNKIDIDVSAIKSAIGAQGKLGVEKGQEGELTYEGPVPLAFGVELVEMTYDEKQQKFLVDGVSEALKMRTTKPIDRAFIGDPTEGNIFVTVKEAPSSP
jgi:hypothetical protein